MEVFFKMQSIGQSFMFTISSHVNLRVNLPVALSSMRSLKKPSLLFANSLVATKEQLPIHLFQTNINSSLIMKKG